MYCFVFNQGFSFSFSCSFLHAICRCVCSKFILSGDMARSQERTDCVSIPWRFGVLDRAIIYCYYVLEWNRMMCFLVLYSRRDILWNEFLFSFPFPRIVSIHTYPYRVRST